MIVGGIGKDTITGGTGADTIYAGHGDDLIAGGAGQDVIYGGRGHDTIIGGTGADTIYAGHGDDLIIGGAGQDVGSGGGHDKGHDTVVGFSLAHGDNIQFSGGTPATIDQVVATSHVEGSNTTITLHDGSTMTLVGITHFDSSFFH